MEWDGGLLMEDRVLVLWNQRETSVWMSGDCQDGPKEDASLVRMNWGFSVWKKLTYQQASRRPLIFIGGDYWTKGTTLISVSGRRMQGNSNHSVGGSGDLGPCYRPVSSHVMAYGTRSRVSPCPELPHLWQKSTTWEQATTTPHPQDTACRAPLHRAVNSLHTSRDPPHRTVNHNRARASVKDTVSLWKGAEKDLWPLPSHQIA